MGMLVQRLNEAQADYENTFRLSGPQKPPTLWHYTTAAGAHAILTDGMMHASHFSHLNDPGEIRFAEELLLRIAHSRQDLHEVFGAFIERFDALSFSRNHEVYVASFSAAPDLRSQWVEYAEAGRGFCVGFDADLLTRKRGPGWRILRVRYGEDECETWFDSFAALVSETLDKTIPAGHALRYHAVEYAADVLSEVLIQALTMKHDAFSAELEWRLVRSIHHAEPPGQFGPAPAARVGREGLISYVPLEVRDAITHVRLGPRCRHGSHLAIESIVGDKHVTIDQSKIPFQP
jgi:hypothetical protein